jgi:2-amino-4-hydroxy-6-hydroxymethyldihydropteridine diphosphokinase
VGLGSNLDSPVRQIRAALSNLAQIRNTSLEKCSSLFKGPAMGGEKNQADYINAVALMTTTLSPLDLLAALQANETLQGRIHGERWGPRIIDLDLLIYGTQTIDEKNLSVPHVGVAERAFVLVPLSELNPELVVPKLGKVSELLKLVDCGQLVRLESGVIG